MPAPEELRRAYAQAQPLLSETRDYVARTLKPYCDANKYMFLDRIKDLDSLSEKLESGRFSSWEALDDLYACTIVIPVPSHEDSVRRKLATSFDEIQVRDRGAAKKAPEVFRFDGMRWYGRMKADAADQRQPGHDRIVFEVQVLTAFEHALALVTHDLVYKADNSDWKRLRLAAQLKAAVEQTELIIVAFESAAEAVRESPWPETDIKAELIQRFKKLMQDGHISETLEPGSWRRFSDNVVQLVRSYERNPDRLQSSVRSLLDIVESEVTHPDFEGPPLSGSLFRYVLSIVNRADTPGNLDKFTIVGSSDLMDLYGFERTKKSFRFEDS